jgi:hypothetical protein
MASGGSAEAAGLHCDRSSDRCADLWTGLGRRNSRA